MSVPNRKSGPNCGSGTQSDKEKFLCLPGRLESLMLSQLLVTAEGQALEDLIISGIVLRRGQGKPREESLTRVFGYGCRGGIRSEYSPDYHFFRSFHCY